MRVSKNALPKLVLVSALLASIAASGRTQEAQWNRLNSKAQELYQKGEYEKAIPVAERALEVAEETFGPEHPNVVTSLNILADLYTSQVRFTDADPLYKRALAIREKTLGPEHPRIAENLIRLAASYYAQGRRAEAETSVKRALAIQEKALGPEHRDLASSLWMLAGLYETRGNCAEAEPLYKRTLVIYENALGPDHPMVGTVLYDLGNLYSSLGKYAEAELLYERTLTIHEDYLGPDDPFIATILQSYADMSRKFGKTQEAESLEIRAQKIYDQVSEALYKSCGESTLREESALKHKLNVEFRPASFVPEEGLTEAVVSRTGKKVYLRNGFELSCADIASAELLESGARPAVIISFTQTGARKLADLTQDNVGNPLAILIDGKVMTVPIIRAPIRSCHLMVEGSFTGEFAERFAECATSEE